MDIVAPSFDFILLMTKTIRATKYHLLKESQFFTQIDCFYTVTKKNKIHVLGYY
jgi:hypothetical protein